MTGEKQENTPAGLKTCAEGNHARGTGAHKEGGRLEVPRLRVDLVHAPSPLPPRAPKWAQGHGSSPLLPPGPGRLPSITTSGGCCSSSSKRPQRVGTQRRSACWEGMLKAALTWFRDGAASGSSVGRTKRGPLSCSRTLSRGSLAALHPALTDDSTREKESRAHSDGELYTRHGERPPSGARYFQAPPPFPLRLPKSEARRPLLASGEMAVVGPSGHPSHSEAASDNELGASGEP